MLAPPPGFVSAPIKEQILPGQASVTSCTFSQQPISFAHEVADGSVLPLHLTPFPKEHLGRWFSIFDEVMLFFLTNYFVLPDFNSCESSSPFQVTGTVNGNVVLSPSNTQTVTEIMWKKGKNKVIEWDSYGVKSYPPFDGRVRVDHTSGDLHISNLTSSDEGEYEVEMLPSSTSKKINLTVFGEYYITWFV